MRKNSVVENSDRKIRSSHILGDECSWKESLSLYFNFYNRKAFADIFDVAGLSTLFSSMFYHQRKDLAFNKNQELARAFQRIFQPHSVEVSVEIISERNSLLWISTTCIKTPYCWGFLLQPNILGISFLLGLGMEKEFISLWWSFPVLKGKDCLSWDQLFVVYPFMDSSVHPLTHLKSEPVGN